MTSSPRSSWRRPGMIGGDFAVGCDGSLAQAEVESLSGLKSLELPARLTFGTAQRLHRLGVTPGPGRGAALRGLPVGGGLRGAAGGGLAAVGHQRRGAVGPAGRAAAGITRWSGRRIARKEAAHHGGRGGGHGRRRHRHRRDRPACPQKKQNLKPFARTDAWLRTSGNGSRLLGHRRPPCPKPPPPHPWLRQPRCPGPLVATATGLL